jgi:hypothetical protein
MYSTRLISTTNWPIETSDGKVLAQAALDAALEEMLFAGGSLNRRLLGGQEAEPKRADKT